MPAVFIIDLFCGAGGFSEGARQAGANVILAVDCWQDALKVHEANHPETAHWCEQLGADPHTFAGRLDAFINEHVPVDGHVHIHASPPCQNLCGANHGRSENEGFRLVDWTFEVIDIVSPDTYTLEQVNNPALMRNYADIPHRVYHMSDHGIPQTRKRVIFGMCPDLPVLSPLTLKQVLTNCGLEFENGVMQTAGRKRDSGNGYHTKPLDAVAYTVTGSSPRTFDGGISKRLPLAAIALLQTFPESTFSVTVKDKRQMIANSVPPTFARMLLRCLTEGA